MVQTSLALSRRSLLWLGAAGVLTSVLLTFCSALTAAEEGKPAGEIRNIPPDRILLHANLKTKPKRADQVQDVWEDVRGIIAVDPETGRWGKVVNDGLIVRVSPDGKFLAIVKVNRAKSKSPYVAESGEIWTCDLTSRTATRILDYGGWMCWSPDGKQVVSTKTHRTDESKSRNVTWRVNRDGSERAKLPVPETDTVGDWSGDGKWFVTVVNRPISRGLQLYRIRPDGTEEFHLTKDGHNCYPRFSPDGRRIVYLRRTREAGHSLHVMDVDGTNDREILREEGLVGVEGSCFSPDGRRLAVVRANQQMKDGRKVYREGEGSFHLEIMDADGKNHRELRLREAKVFWLGHPDWR